MEPKDLKTLLLLEAIDKEEYQSQRKLSKELNISLGLVNTFIKNLTVRGIFKAIKLSKNRKGYILSQEGMIEKANLTKKYLSYSINHYKDIKDRVTAVLTRLENDGKKNIVLYGSGELCEIACMIIGQNKSACLKIVDDKKAGRKICGLEIEKEYALINSHFDAVVIMDFKNIASISRYLTDKGVPNEKIYDISFH